MRLRDLFGQSASAISDQGFFALGNFAVNTILARQMSQAAFGTFSSAFAAFLLLSTAYCAFVIDPMLIYGVSTASELQRSYVRRVVSLHWRMAFALSLVLLGIGFIRWRIDGLQGELIAYVGWALAAPAVLRLWLARRTAYLVLKPHYAALAGGAYLLVVALLLFAFGHALANNAIAACALVAVTSALISFFLHRSLPLVDKEAAANAAEHVVGSHWRFGKWASIAGILSLFPDYVYFFVLSPEQCGQYRALINVVLPLVQVYNAMGVLMMSYFARHRDDANFAGIIRRTAFGFCGLAAILAIIAASVGGKLFNLLYDGKYDLRFSLLWPLALVSALFAYRMVSDALLRSIENVTWMAAISIAGAGAAIVIGIPMAMKFGILGAVYGDLAVYLLTTATILAAWLRLFRRFRSQSRFTNSATEPAAHRPQITTSEAPLQSVIES